MPKSRDPKISVPRSARALTSSAVDPLSLSKRLTTERRAELNPGDVRHEQVETPHSVLERPSTEGRGHAKGDDLLQRAGRGAEARERIEQGLGEIGRQRQDGGIGFGFSATFGSGKGKQTFGVIADPGGGLGLGAVGAGIVHGDKGYDFGLGTGKVGGPVKVTTLDDITGSGSGSKSGASSGGSTPSPPVPPVSNENASSEPAGSEGKHDAEKEDDSDNSGESKSSGESNDSNTSEGDYPTPEGDPAVIPTPDENTGNGEYSDGSDGTPSGSLERKTWLDPRGVSTGCGKSRQNLTRPVLGPISVGPRDGDGRGTGGFVIGTRNDRPVVPDINGGGNGFKPSPCPEDILAKRHKPV